WQGARGSPKSNFDYQLTIKNDSGRNLTVSFAASAPKNFETSFTEAYGSQELSSIPIEAGQSKDVKLHVRPPSSVDAGHYPVAVTVSAEDANAKAEVAPGARRSGRTDVEPSTLCYASNCGNNCLSMNGYNHG